MENSPVTIISSTIDPASRNIARNLVDNLGFREEIKGNFLDPSGTIRMVTTEKPPIFVDMADVPGDTCSMIFASKHVSATNTPALTIHATRNLTKKAEFGGKPEEVSFVDPARVQAAIRKLGRVMTRDGIKIGLTMEATHHGATSFPVPVLFVEIGSGPSEWMDPRLGRVAAEAIMEAARADSGSGEVAVGFGGSHYSPKFTRLSVEGTYQVGHIVPRHAFEAGISDTVLRATLEKTRGPNPKALVDWKGLRGEDRRKLVTLLESWGYKVERC